MTAKAYSYIRFSTPEQAKGDSLRRQMQASRAYAEAHGLELDERLTMRDTGLSAYKGAHRTKGALGEFLRQVKAGAIERGSVLIVESLDRLSREEVIEEALPQFLNIIGAGIKVVTLTDHMEYAANANIGQLVMSLVIMSRAHEESAIKAKRVAAAWQQKRKQATKKKMTRQAPAWLRLSEDRSHFEIIPERAAVVRMIFQMKTEGVGSESIARRLNELDVWKPEPKGSRNRAGGWRNSYVQKILKTRAVIGEFQPHRMENGKRVPDGEPIPKYFPRVVDRKLFDRVQAIRARNAQLPGHGGGYIGPVSNLFGHLARCAKCGGTMMHVNKGPKPKGGEYLQCDTARRGLGCDKSLIRYDWLEPLLLHFCKGLDPRILLTDASERMAAGAIRREKRQEIEGQLSQIASQIENLTDSIGGTPDRAVRKTLEERLSTVLKRQAELEGAKTEIASTVSEKANTPEAIAKQIRNIEELLARMDTLRGEERADLRRRLRHELHQLIDRVEVKPASPGTALFVYFRDGAEVRLLLDTKGGLRLVADSSLIYRLDGEGNVTDDPDDDPDGGGAKQRQVRQQHSNARIEKAIRKQGVNPDSPRIKEGGCARRPQRSRARVWRAPGL